MTPWRYFYNKVQELIKIRKDYIVFSEITEEMKSNLVGAEGIVLPLILAELLKKLLMPTQKTTHAKRQVVPNRENGIPIQPKPKAT